jgi:hypothetical protein
MIKDRNIASDAQIAPHKLLGANNVSARIIYCGTAGTNAYAQVEDRGVPFLVTTLNAAMDLCTANRGDTIYVLAGHSEDPLVSITCDIAGVSIIGLGQGSNRPTITFGAAGATLAMTAASVYVSGLRFDLGTVAATVTNAINITGDSCHVDRCETVVHATSQFTNHLTATDAQFVKITNNKFHSLHTASSTSGVVLDGCDDLTMTGNQIMGHFSEHAVDNTTPGSCDEILRANISDNLIMNNSTTAGDLVIELDANATGFFARNMLSGGLATIAANFDIGNMSCLESYIVDDEGIDVHGLQLGTAAA